MDQDVMNSRRSTCIRLFRLVCKTTYDVHSDAETQYVFGGARLVSWAGTLSPTVGLDRNQQLTIGPSVLIPSNVTLDLLTGELRDTGNYYANGARESFLVGGTTADVGATTLGVTIGVGASVAAESTVGTGVLAAEASSAAGASDAAEAAVGASVGALAVTAE